MVCVVGVRFKKAGKVYYFDPAEYPIAVGAKVVVETARGVEYGEVAVGPKDVPEDQVVQPLKKVLRLGTDKDVLTAAENRRKEKEAFAIAQKKIANHGLEMTLVDVEYTFDNSKVIFYFTAEGRVDFRELVRDLAGVFRTRIEMRQIGVRDEAKLLGGIGPCGRVLCCTSFLGDFAPVSIRMAKDQNLSLNPSKISGLCGRLMCCLRYEQETYEAAKKDPTLAPSYIPPAIPDDADEIAEMEDSPVPAIGMRRSSGPDFGARIAKAAGVTEMTPPRSDRRPGRPVPGERRQETAPASRALEGPPSRPTGSPRPQGTRPSGDRPAQPPRGEKRGANPRQAADKQAVRPARPPQGSAPRRATPGDAVSQAPGEGNRAERSEASREQRHRGHRGQRRRTGDKPQQAERTQDGQAPQT